MSQAEGDLPSEGEKRREIPIASTVAFAYADTVRSFGFPEHVLEREVQHG
jgi:hypothetical protein